MDEKDKARRVRKKAVEEIQSQIDLLDGEMNTYRNGIKDLEENYAIMSYNNKWLGDNPWLS